MNQFQWTVIFRPKLRLVILPLLPSSFEFCENGAMELWEHRRAAAVCRGAYRQRSLKARETTRFRDAVPVLSTTLMVYDFA